MISGPHEEHVVLLVSDLFEQFVQIDQLFQLECLDELGEFLRLLLLVLGLVAHDAHDLVHDEVVDLEDLAVLLALATLLGVEEGDEFCP